MPVDTLTPNSVEAPIISPDVARLVKEYKEAQVAPEGAVAYRLVPHKDRDRQGRITVDPYGREDISLSSEVFVLLQAGNSENPQRPNDFRANESHRAVLARVRPSTSGVAVDCAYLTFNQKVESLDPEVVVDTFSTDPHVVFSSYEVAPHELGSMAILSKFPPSISGLKQESNIDGVLQTIDRRGAIMPKTEAVVLGKKGEYPTTINLGLPYDAKREVLGDAQDNKIIQVRQKTT